MVVGLDVVIFVYSIWPAEYHKYDSDYYMEGLQWLIHFIRRRFGPFVPVFWLGPKHHLSKAHRAVSSGAP